jgi:hypothetical protein
MTATRPTSATRLRLGVLHLALILLASSWVLACADDDGIAPRLSLVESVVSIEISPHRDTLNSLPDSVQLSAIAYDADHNPLAVPITWASLDTTRATVDGTGLVVSTHERGTARITATSGSVTQMAKVLVRQVVHDMGLVPAEDTLDAVGAQVTLTVAPTDSNGSAISGGTVEYASLDTAFVSVDNAGVVTAKRTTKGSGRARIRVSLTGDEIRAGRDTAFITVRQIPATVVVQDDTINAIGDTIQLSATATDANGNPVPLTFRSLKDIITVTKTGLAWSNATGTARVEVRSGGVVYDTLNVVSDQVVASIEVTPAAPAIAVADTLSLIGIARDSNAVVIPNAQFAWTTPSAAVTLSHRGLDRSPTTLMTGASVGTARIRARFRTLDTFIDVAVSAADAATHNWTGATSTAFAEAGNWSPAFALVATDTAVIVAAANQPALSADATLAKLVVQAGATFDVGAYVLTLTDDLLVSGSMSSAGGRVVLQKATGSVQGAVSDISITGSYSISAPTVVTGTLSIQAGSLTISDQPVVIRD